MSSEPESTSGHGGQTSSHQIELRDLEGSQMEKHRPTSRLKRALVQQDREDLYNFKGFMFFCFGAPGVSPHWCSKCTVVHEGTSVNGRWGGVLMIIPQKCGNGCKICHRNLKKICSYHFEISNTFLEWTAIYLWPLYCML